MRPSRMTVAALAALLLTSVAALPIHADDTTQPAAADSLENSMDTMGKDMKALRSQLTDPAKNESSLKLLGDFEKNVIIAKTFLPEKVEAMTGDAKDKASAEYRGMLVKLLGELLKIEQDVLDGKNDDAVKTFAGLRPIEKAGHQEFRPKEG